MARTNQEGTDQPRDASVLRLFLRDRPGRSCDATGASFSNLIGLNMSRILAFEGRTEMVLSVDLIHPHLPFFSLAKCEFRCGERTDSA
jgi:hypothetical protein